MDSFELAPEPDDFASATPVAVHRATSVPDAEEYVLACCLLDEGATLTKALRDGLTSTDFANPSHATIYSALAAMHRAGTPIATDTLVEQLGPQLATIGLPAILDLTDPARTPTTAHAGHRIRTLLDASERRRLERLGRELTENRPLEELRAVAERLQPRTRTTNLDHTTRRIRLAAPPKEPTTRLFLAGKPIATPGNLVTLISKAKTGKTATIGAAITAIVGAHYDRPNLDTFKFSAPHTAEAVVLIDTEQSPYDAWTCHSRALSRAHQPDDPEWLHHYALVGLDAHTLRNSLKPILDGARASHKGIFTLILDGVADYVTSVNDEAECNEFISWLRAIAVEYDCPVICVIHSNEAQKSGDDGRGHLGKQLTRKAESNLLLRKQGDITTITSEKQRKAPITESDAVAFRWSDEQQRHVSCDPVIPQSPAGRRRSYKFDDFAPIFPFTQAAGMGFRPLLRLAQEISPSMGSSSFETLLEEGLNRGLILKDKSNPKQPRYYAAQKQ